MILHSIELRNVGPFLGDVRLGPFEAGLNIVAAPNEAGKTTALRAAARALFDRHTTKDGEMKALQPAGTDLAPRIAVDFETAAGRFRIEKNFLQTPASVLQNWRSSGWSPLAEGDAADRRVQELLNSTLPGRGSTKPEHWGFLGFLWARQGDASIWPMLNGDALGSQIRARLIRVELDPVVERLRAHLSAEAEEIITSTGRPRVNGPLERSEEELARIDAALTSLQQTRAELEVAHQRHDQAAGAVSHLEREYAEREQAAQALAEQASAAERLRMELDARQVELATAQAKLEQVLKDADALRTRQDALAVAQKASVLAEETAAAAEKELLGVRAAIDECQAARPEHDRSLMGLREAHQQTRGLIRYREAVSQATALLRQLNFAEKTERDLAAHLEKRSRLAAVTTKQIKELEEGADRIKTLKARVEALGLTVELTAERDADVRIDGSGESRVESLRGREPHRIQSPESLYLELSGWGRIVIRSGADDVKNAAAKLSKAEAEFQADLQKAEVPTLEVAREALSARAALDLEIKAATTAHLSHLGEHATVAVLRDSAAAAQRRAEALASALTIAPQNHESVSLAELEAEDARLLEAIPAAESVLRRLDDNLANLRAREREASETVRDCGNAASQHRTTVRTVESQITSIKERYPNGIDQAKTDAASEAVKAEVRRDEVRKQLPPDFEALPERNRRAAAALQQITNELAIRRAERDSARGALETLGGQGIYSRETALEEQRAEILLRRDAARSRGWAARIASDLIDYRKQAATRAVLSPLEDRLTAAFSRLSGNSDRHVFLDENLQIIGLGRERESAYAFEALSQGAREQLLLCLRIAVAQELATEEPQTLILDDALVNTDSVRQERILDLLTHLSSKLQILILTCHPDRYRGVGQSVVFRTE